MLNNRGMSLIELLVAIAIGMVISGAMGALVITNIKVRQETSRVSEQVENGRIAMDMLQQDIRMAGYWDGLEYTDFADPAAMPDICEKDDMGALKTAVPVFVQGVDVVATVPSCLSAADVRPGTDIIVVRRAATCAQGDTGCEAIGPYFQASQCSPPVVRSDGSSGTVTTGELASTDTNNWYGVATATGSLTLHKRDCGNATIAGAPNLAEVRHYITRIYFVANSDVAGDGLPSLKVAEIRGSSWSISTIASGIEQMQIEYGLVDTDADGTPDSYVALPATVAEWRGITAVKLHLISRNSSASPGFTDTKTYLLGKKADGNDNVYGPFNDNIRRHVFSGLVGLTNPAGLRGI